LGTGGISAGDSWNEAVLENLEFRRSLVVCGDAKLPCTGAVCGVLGVAGVGGIMPALLFGRKSHFFVEGVIAILARESFCDIERSRLCGADLIMGDAEVVEAVSKGSELRKECVAGLCGVSGQKGTFGEKVDAR
jgi:hypothetical protein